MQNNKMFKTLSTFAMAFGSAAAHAQVNAPTIDFLSNINEYPTEVSAAAAFVVASTAGIAMVLGFNKLMDHAEKPKGPEKVL